LDNTLLRRTFQRRLALLVAQGQIEMLGEARSVRYVRLPPTVEGVLAAKEAAGDTMRALGEVYVPTSPDGAEINAFVRQPRALRPPVGTSWSSWSNIIRTIPPRRCVAPVP
jgi:hypothetical protein